MGGFRGLRFWVLGGAIGEWGRVGARTVSRPREMVPTNLESVIRGARILIVVFQDDGFVFGSCVCRRDVVVDAFVESKPPRDVVAYHSRGSRLAGALVVVRDACRGLGAL
jgi:hypothetical protein